MEEMLSERLFKFHVSLLFSIYQIFWSKWIYCVDVREQNDGKTDYSTAVLKSSILWWWQTFGYVSQYVVLYGYVFVFDEAGIAGSNIHNNNYVAQSIITSTNAKRNAIFLEAH